MDSTTFNTLTTITDNAGVFWLTVSAALVFLMQGGFLALEAGLSQSKNNVNVAVKNLTDVGISTFLYWVIGYGFMYGASEGFLGTDTFMPDVGQGGAELAIGFLFQAVFASTAVTILSGAVVGRMKFTSYIVVACIVSGLIYPIYGSWVWNGDGWLAKEGFTDFAGSTVVHSIGGWVAFAALLVIGARKGRFNKDGTANDMPASNLSIALIGVIILWFGWFGFNGGSELAWFSGSDDKVMEFSAVTVDAEVIATAEETLGITIDPASLVIVGTDTVTISEVSFPIATADTAFGVSFTDLSADVETTLPGTSSAVPGIIANTAVGGAAGLLAALALGWVLTKTPQVGSVGNGALAGLVAVTANCHSTTALSAVIIGAIGGVVAIGAEQALLKFKIDDVVGAIPVHLAAGIWGTLAFAIFAESSYLGDNTRMEQLVVQVMGIAAAAVWAGGGTFVLLYGINKIMPLRVSEEEEAVGLNSEHGIAPMPPMGMPAAAGAMD